MSTSKVSLVAVAAAAKRLKSGNLPKIKRPAPPRAAPKIRVCVLTSSYDGADSPTQDYDDYKCSPRFWVDRDKEKYEFVEVSVKKADSYCTVRELVASGKYDVFYNLCDGAKDEKRAGIDVIQALEALNAAYTGGDSKGFEPNKVDMKVLVANANVKTPNFVLVDSPKDLAKKCRHLKFPVIVKHMSGYASVGITKDSKCETLQQLDIQVRKSIKAFNHALVEEFITGREGTVLVCPDPKLPFGVRVFQPLMFAFLKNAADFNHFDNKWDCIGELQFLPNTDPAYAKVQSMARNAFTHIMNGIGYGRCDFRIDEKGDVYFLEINANCGMYYDNTVLPEGDYADQMVTAEKNVDGYHYDDFIGTQIAVSLKAQGIRAPWYCISHDAHGNFSTRASRNVVQGTPIFSDPTYPIPVVAKALYTLGEDDAAVGCVICRGDGINSVVAIRHSCEPNMQFVHGRTLTFEASRPISKGEELTVDYSTLRDPKMPAFACSCGTTACRSVIFSDRPTPRVSQQRRKWERRERMLAIRRKKSASAAAAAAAVLEEEGIGAAVVEPSGDNVIGGISSAPVKLKLSKPPRGKRAKKVAMPSSVHIQPSQPSFGGATDQDAALAFTENIMSSVADSLTELELMGEEGEDLAGNSGGADASAETTIDQSFDNHSTTSHSTEEKKGSRRQYKLQPTEINHNTNTNNNGGSSQE